MKHHCNHELYAIWFSSSSISVDEQLVSKLSWKFYALGFHIASIALSIHVLILESELNNTFPLILMGLEPDKKRIG